MKLAFTRSAVKDDLILLSQNEIRILQIDEQDEESIHSGSLKLPKADAEVKYYPEGGRAYIFGWAGNYLAETEAIAQLEKNTALSQMFYFRGGSKFGDIKFYIMSIILVLTIILLHK